MYYYGVMFEELFSSSGLSLDRLRGFLEMADAGSIAKAAQGDLNRQSLISRQIRELEEFFGVELTVRRGKSLALSEAGQRLQLLIRGQFHDLSDFRRQQLKQQRIFSIGAGASVLEWLVLPAASSIREALGSCCLKFSSRRSLELVEAVRDGQLDFAIVREDALPEGALRSRIAKMTFQLCYHPQLLAGVGRGGKEKVADRWKNLPFAANSGGGQLDRTFRAAMERVCGAFRPAFECDSLLQVRELVKRGVCAGVLASIGTSDLEKEGVVVTDFAPLTGYGRPLVLHWNERQMRRRAIESRTIEAIAASLKGTFG